MQDQICIDKEVNYYMAIQKRPLIILRVLSCKGDKKRRGFNPLVAVASASFVDVPTEVIAKLHRVLSGTKSQSALEAAPWVAREENNIPANPPFHLDSIPILEPA